MLLYTSRKQFKVHINRKHTGTYKILRNGLIGSTTTDKEHHKPALAFIQCTQMSSPKTIMLIQIKQRALRVKAEITGRSARLNRACLTF